MLDSVLTSNKTHTSPWVPAALSSINSTFVGFQTEEGFERKTASGQIGIIFECYIVIDVGMKWRARSGIIFPWYTVFLPILISLMKCGSTSIVLLCLKSTIYPQRKNPSQTWALKIWSVFYNTTGCTIERYTQRNGKEFRCLYFYCCPPSQLRGLEPFLRAEAQKGAIELCDTATFYLCWFQIQLWADETCGLWKLRLYI